MAHADSGLHDYDGNYSLRFPSNEYSGYMDHSVSPILDGMNHSNASIYDQPAVTNEVILEEITSAPPRSVPLPDNRSYRSSPYESMRPSSTNQPRRWRLVPANCTCLVHGQPGSTRSASAHQHARDCEASRAYEHASFNEYEDQYYNPNSNSTRSRGYYDELEKLKGSVHQLSGEITQVRQSSRSSRRAPREQMEPESTKKTIDAEFKTLHGKLSEQREGLMKRHELELAGKDQERERLENRLSECQQKLAEANMKTENAIEAKRKLKQELNEAVAVMEQEADRANANEAMRRMLDQEVAVRIKVQNELQKMQRTVEPLLTDLESLKSQLDSKSSELESILILKQHTEGEIMQEREQWRFQLDSKETECQELRNQVSFSVTQLETERAQTHHHAQEKDQNISYLEERLRSLEKLHVDAEEIWRSGEQNILREKSRLEEEVKDLKKRLELAEKRLDQAEKDRDKAKQDLKKALADLEELKSLYAQERQTLEFELDNFKSGHESLQTRLDSSEQTLREAEQEIKQLRLKHHEATAEKDKHIEKIKLRLQQEKDEIAAERDEALKDRDQAMHERDSAIKGRDQAVLDREEVMFFADEAKGQREDFLKQVNDASRERDEAIQERNDALHQRDEALEKYELLHEVLREKDEQLKEHNEVLRERDETLSQLSASSSQREEITQQRDAIAKERDELLSDIEQLNSLIKDQELVIDELQLKLKEADEDILARATASQAPLEESNQKVQDLQKELESTKAQFEEEKEKLRVEAEIREKRLQQGIIMLDAKLKSSSPSSPGPQESSATLKARLDDEARAKKDALEKNKELEKEVEELKKEAAFFLRQMEKHESEKEHSHTASENGVLDTVDLDDANSDAEAAEHIPFTEEVVKVKHYQVLRLQYSVRTMREMVKRLTVDVNDQKIRTEELRLKMEKENYELKKKMVMDDIEFARIKSNTEEFDAFLRDLEDMRLEVLEYERENVDLRSKLARVEEVVTGEPSIHNQSRVNSSFPRYPSPKFEFGDISLDGSRLDVQKKGLSTAELDGRSLSARTASPLPLPGGDEIAVENEVLKGKIETLRKALFDKMEESEKILQESIIISPTPPPPDTPTSFASSGFPTPTSSGLPTPTTADAKKPYVPTKADDEIDVLISRELPAAAEIPPNFERLEKGVYQFGTKKINMEIKNGTLVVRVGGGYMLFVEFVRKYGRIEVQKTKRGVGVKKEEEKPERRHASPEKKRVVDTNFHTPLPTPTLVRRGRELKLVPH